MKATRFLSGTHSGTVVAISILDCKINIPIIHIVSETAKEIQKHQLSKVALLGTKVTMTAGFYANIFEEYGIETLVPGESDMDVIHDSIYNEFSQGVFSKEMKNKYLEIMNGLIQQGAEGIVLGCTEIPILIKPEDTDTTLFNTTNIHVKAAVDFALK